jgi:hypothetical protein
MRPRMRLGSLLCFALLIVFASTGVLATQLAPLFQEGELGVVLRAVVLPPTLRKDLVSGLTNRILIRMTFASARRPGVQRLAGIAVKYDLWEETFVVKVTLDDVVVSSTTYQTVDEVISMLTDITLPRLFPVDAAADTGHEISLAAEILFDPIEKARMEEVRKWVAETDRPSPPDGTGLSPGLSAPRSTSARVFNRIFAQYAAGAPVAATWKQTVASKPFKLEELRNVP